MCGVFGYVGQQTDVGDDDSYRVENARVPRI